MRHKQTVQRAQADIHAGRRPTTAAGSQCMSKSFITGVAGGIGRGIAQCLGTKGWSSAGLATGAFVIGRLQNSA
jgi:hypothetical protein